MAVLKTWKFLSGIIQAYIVFFCYKNQNKQTNKQTKQQQQQQNITSIKSSSRFTRSTTISKQDWYMKIANQQLTKSTVYSSMQIYHYEIVKSSVDINKHTLPTNWYPAQCLLLPELCQWGQWTTNWITNCLLCS